MTSSPSASGTSQGRAHRRELRGGSRTDECQWEPEPILCP